MKAPTNTRTAKWTRLKVVCAWLAFTACFANATQEFIGPFPSWADVNYGAIMASGSRPTEAMNHLTGKRQVKREPRPTSLETETRPP